MYAISAYGFKILCTMEIPHVDTYGLFVHVFGIKNKKICFEHINELTFLDQNVRKSAF